MGLLFGILVVFGYGLFFIIWPKKAREWFLRPYNLDAPTQWYKPKTWLKFTPSLGVFRIPAVSEQYRLYYIENLRPKVSAASLVFGQSFTRLWLFYFGVELTH